MTDTDLTTMTDVFRRLIAARREVDASAEVRDAEIVRLYGEGRSPRQIVSLIGKALDGLGVSEAGLGASEAQVHAALSQAGVSRRGRGVRRRLQLSKP